MLRGALFPGAPMSLAIHALSYRPLPGVEGRVSSSREADGGESLPRSMSPSLHPWALDNTWYCQPFCLILGILFVLFIYWFVYFETGLTV